MTSAEEYYEIIKDMGTQGQLFYLTKKGVNEYLFECVIVDTVKKTETINRLKRAMLKPNFIGFPGTPEFNTFLEEAVADSETNQ